MISRSLLLQPVDRFSAIVDLDQLLEQVPHLEEAMVELKILGPDQLLKMGLSLVDYLLYGEFGSPKTYSLLHSGSQTRGLFAIFLFGAAGPVLLFGLLGQPTNLGFAAFGSGFVLPLL